MSSGDSNVIKENIALDDVLRLMFQYRKYLDPAMGPSVTTNPAAVTLSFAFAMSSIEMFLLGPRSQNLLTFTHQPTLGIRQPINAFFGRGCFVKLKYKYPAFAVRVSVEQFCIVEIVIYFNYLPF